MKSAVFWFEIFSKRFGPGAGFSSVELESTYETLQCLHMPCSRVNQEETEFNPREWLVRSW